MGTEGKNREQRAAACLAGGLGLWPCPSLVQKEDMWVIGALLHSHHEGTDNDGSGAWSWESVMSSARQDVAMGQGLWQSPCPEQARHLAHGFNINIFGTRRHRRFII